MKVNDDFNLVIVCFDDICFNILSALNLPNISLIKLDNFEDERLKKIKKTRTLQEYCWTCTPVVPLYVLKNLNNITQTTYLDADLFFFSDYEILFNELKDGSVLITEHRYAENAEKLNLKNFCTLVSHKLVVPAMNALLSDKNNKIDAFLCPGHVSVIIGSDAYAPVVKNFAKPCVVAGFEPLQIIDGIAEICSQLADNDPKVASIYHAAVTPAGNKTAQDLIAEYFQPCDGPWRGR